MKVTNNPAQNIQQANESNAAKRSERAGANRGSASNALDGDRAQISNKAKEFLQAKEIAKNSPSTREEKIAELKRRIANGEYNRPPEAVADKLVDNHMQTRDIG